MHPAFHRSLALALCAFAAHASAQITFFENDNFQGRSIREDRSLSDLERAGFGSRSTSIVVEGPRWEVCEDLRFGGRCAVLRPGHYASPMAMRLAGRIASARPLERDAWVEESRYAPSGATVQLVLYEGERFEGRSLTLDGSLEDFRRSAFNNRAASAQVFGERWEICEDNRFAGRCVVFPPGAYLSLAGVGLGQRVSSARVLERVAEVRPPSALPARITVYERENYEGRSMDSERSVENLNDSGFNNRISSVVVDGERWEACSDSGYRGRCVFLVPGRYPSLATTGLNNSISSLRIAPEPAVMAREPMPLAPAYDYRRRGDERLFEAPVRSVRAVYGASEQRCWVEREPVASGRGPSLGGGLVGGLIGGILGHQIGGGSGRDLATVGGAVAGAVIGSNVARGSQGPAQGPEVQRCTNNAAQAVPAYWDVVYSFRGQEHRVQLSVQPGATILVNDQGEPRA